MRKIWVLIEAPFRLVTVAVTVPGSIVALMFCGPMVIAPGPTINVICSLVTGPFRDDPMRECTIDTKLFPLPERSPQSAKVAPPSEPAPPKPVKAKPNTGDKGMDELLSRRRDGTEVTAPKIPLVDSVSRLIESGMQQECAFFLTSMTGARSSREDAHITCPDSSLYGRVDNRTRAYVAPRIEGHCGTAGEAVVFDADGAVVAIDGGKTRVSVMPPKSRAEFCAPAESMVVGGVAFYGLSTGTRDEAEEGVSVRIYEGITDPTGACRWQKEVSMLRHHGFELGGSCAPQELQ